MKITENEQKTNIIEESWRWDKPWHSWDRVIWRSMHWYARLTGARAFRSNNKTSRIFYHEFTDSGGDGSFSAARSRFGAVLTANIEINHISMKLRWRCAVPFVLGCWILVALKMRSHWENGTGKFINQSEAALFGYKCADYRFYFWFLI